MSARQLIWSLVLLWATFGVLTFELKTDNVFHCINAIGIAAALTSMAAYFPGLLDAWRTRARGLSDGQLLVLGVFVTLLGFVVRLGRWYVTEDVPVHNGGVAAWAYNVGLWVSVCGAALLVGALATSDPKWTTNRVMVHTAAFLALTVILLQFDMVFAP